MKAKLIIIGALSALAIVACATTSGEGYDKGEPKMEKHEKTKKRDTYGSGASVPRGGSYGS